MSKRNEIFVIGSGPAGYGAAKKLSENNISTKILEKNSYFGGHCASFNFEEGFIFDDGPHISFSKEQRITDLFNDNANNDINEFVPYVDNYWRGHWIKHPAITSMHGLPAELNSTILTEIIEAKYKVDDTSPVKGYDEWLIRSYGETYARNFPMEYTIKYHTCEAKDMTTDWLGPRLYQPNLEEVIFGMLSPVTPDKHYISKSRYPNQSGFSNFLSEAKEIAPILYQNEVTEIDIAKKTFTVNNTETADYDHLISSMPLDKIMNIIPAAPRDLVDAANKLSCTQCMLVNIGVNRENVSEAHWTYIYDHDICFTRLSFPHKFSPQTVPDGCSSIQAELYFSDKYRPINVSIDQCIENTINDLINIGILESKDEVIFRKAWLIPYAQVIFDHDRQPAVDLIHEFLRDNNIEYCGRFGEWAYIWSDESFMSGEKAVQRILD